MSITHQENIGYWHFSHSYCRGNWRDSNVTTPMLLAKCCHDFDLFQWFVDKPCKSVSSYGDLSFFNKKNQPDGAANSCLDGCKYYDSCPYSVKKIYLAKTGILHYSARQITGLPSPSQSQFEQALRKNNYGKCVFATDNNVCDHQVVSMEFDGGATVSMAVSAFSKDCFRNIHVHCSKGEIIGRDVDNKFVVNVFGGKSRVVKTKIAGKGHLGGDLGICATFHSLMNNQPVDENYMTTIDVTLLSHQAVFAAEKSRAT
ncbi:MAG: Gfo/Idh/MocA family oxidoreductase, partial [Clostridia bacterium]